MNRTILVPICLLWSGIALADCDMESWARDAADARESSGVVEETLCYIELLDAMDLAAAQEHGRGYDEELERRGHPVAAYKIGIHLPSVQPRFGLSGPLFGVLHGEGALFGDNGEVPVQGQALAAGTRSGPIYMPTARPGQARELLHRRQDLDGYGEFQVGMRLRYTSHFAHSRPR